MTGLEANQHYDLWVDRCREHLARGAASNELAAWMQSEGVSADMVVDILTAAGAVQSAGDAPDGRPEEAALPQAQIPPAAPGSTQDQAPPQMASEAPLATERETPRTQLAGTAEKVPGPSGAAALAPGEAGQDLKHPDTRPSRPPPSSLFGRPRPPGDVAAAPPAPDPARPEVSARGKTAPQQPAVAPAASARGGTDIPEDRPDPTFHGYVDDDLAGGDQDPAEAAPDGAAVTPPGRSPQDAGADEPATVAGIADPVVPVESHHMDEQLDRVETSGDRMTDPDSDEGATMQYDPDRAASEMADDEHAPADHAHEASAGDPADARTSELEAQAGRPSRQSRQGRGFGRRSGTPRHGDRRRDEALPATADEPAVEAPSSGTAGPRAGLASEREQDGRPREDDAARRPAITSAEDLPETGDELAAAAKRLGISFRDDPRSGRGDFDGEDDETVRAAQELGISFRDQPAAAAVSAFDEVTARAAQELRISFRDATESKPRPKSLLRRYWPMIALMLLAAIGMPIAAVMLLYFGD
ncbi:MAG: hypothetical protein JSU82_06520 [Rhodospirillales bacterium]|nr:MAG: hypothetical protein JSU82_06520 [Rhodospirillales bacterium]